MDGFARGKFYFSKYVYRYSIVDKIFFQKKKNEIEIGKINNILQSVQLCFHLFSSSSSSS